MIRYWLCTIFLGGLLVSAGSGCCCWDCWDSATCGDCGYAGGGYDGSCRDCGGCGNWRDPGCRCLGWDYAERWPSTWGCEGWDGYTWRDCGPFGCGPMYPGPILGLVDLFRRGLMCAGCGGLYCGEWISDPPACHDPCGGPCGPCGAGDCGRCGDGGCGCDRCASADREHGRRYSWGHPKPACPDGICDGSPPRQAPARVQKAKYENAQVRPTYERRPREHRPPRQAHRSPPAPRIRIWN
jgi:hypothetical protein